MINLQYSPRLQGATPRMRQKKYSFKSIDITKGYILEMVDFVVETDEVNQRVNSYMNSGKQQIVNDYQTVKINARAHYVIS